MMLGAGSRPAPVNGGAFLLPGVAKRMPKKVPPCMRAPRSVAPEQEGDLQATRTSRKVEQQISDGLAAGVGMLKVASELALEAGPCSGLSAR
jgi:hypothetical protein